MIYAGTRLERLFKMRAQTIEIQDSTGRILSSAIFRPGGKKLMAKGHILREEDIRVLQSEGMQQIWVTELEEGEISEDEAVCSVAGEMACGSYEIGLPGEKVNLSKTINKPNCQLLCSSDNRPYEALLHFPDRESIRQSGIVAMSEVKWISLRNNPPG